MRRKSLPKKIFPYWKFYLPNILIYFSLLIRVIICLEGGLEHRATCIETLQENERRINENKLQPIFSVTAQKLNNFTLWSFSEYKHCIWSSVLIIPHFYFLSITKDTSCSWGVLLVTIAQPQPWCFAGAHGAAGQESLKEYWGATESCWQQTTQLTAGTAVTKSSSVTIVGKTPHKSNCFLFILLQDQVTFEAFRVKFSLAANLKSQAFQCSTFLQSRKTEHCLL